MSQGCIVCARKHLHTATLVFEKGNVSDSLLFYHFYSTEFD